MSNRELIEELRHEAAFGPHESMSNKLLRRAAAALEVLEWRPIEAAPTTALTPIEIGWWEDGWDGIELVQLLVSRSDWRPGSDQKVWMNLNSNNYRSLQAASQWPTHWRLPTNPAAADARKVDVSG